MVKFLVYFTVLYVFNGCNVTKGDDEDLKNFLLSLEACLVKIEQNKFPGNAV